MKKVSVLFHTFFICIGIMLNNAPLFSAQESASSVAQKEERSQLQRIYNWLFEKYGMPQEDWKIIKKWLIKKWRRQEIEPALGKKANSIFKKYIIPVVVIAALVAGTGVWWRKKGIEQRAQAFLDRNLLEAAHEGNKDIAEVYFDAGANLEARDDEFGETPLIKALRMGHEEVVDLLLDKGADINATDSISGRTPLMWAAFYNNKDVVKLLIDRGADIAESKNGETAAQLTTSELIKKMIQAAQEGTEEAMLCAEIEKKREEGEGLGDQLLRATGNEEMVKLLLDAGADIEAEDQKGQTALIKAAYFPGTEDVVKLLIETGADIDARDQFGTTALMNAAQEGYQDTVQLLLGAKANKEYKDRQGWTALMLAAIHGNEEVVALLLKHKADIEAKDWRGKTAAGLAKTETIRKMIQAAQKERLKESKQEEEE